MLKIFKLFWVCDGEEENEERRGQGTDDVFIPQTTKKPQTLSIVQQMYD